MAYVAYKCDWFPIDLPILLTIDYFSIHVILKSYLSYSNCIDVILIHVSYREKKRFKEQVI